MGWCNTLWPPWATCLIIAVASMIIREPADAYIAAMFIISSIMYIEDKYLKKDS